VPPLGVQVKVEASVALVGVSDALDSTGAVFVTVAVAAPVSVPPSESVAVAVQVIVSPLEAVDAERVRLELVPRALEPLVHS
jgi:hypothetical protein